LGIRKIFLSQTNDPIALIFGMKQTWTKEIQICANKVPVVRNGPTPKKGTFFKKSSDELSSRSNVKIFGMDHPNDM